jgi:hypothetical protein
VPRLLVTALRNADPTFMQRHMDGSTQPLDVAMSHLAKAHGVE